MIEYESVLQLAEQTKKKFTSAKDRIPEIEQQIFDLSASWRDTLFNGGTDGELQEIENKISRFEKQLELLRNIDVNKEIQQNLRRDKTLSAKCSEFEAQQRKAIEGLLKEEKTLSESVLNTTDSLVQAIKDWRTKRQEIADICIQIGQVHPYTGSSEPVPYSGYYETYKPQMANINPATLASKIRTAGGLSISND